MAKKIKVAQINGASESLKQRKIEHVLVKYVKKDGSEGDAFLVVMNKYYHDAKAAISRTLPAHIQLCMPWLW